MDDRWTVLLPAEIDPAGPDSLTDIATLESAAQYGTVEDLRAAIHRYDAIIDRLLDLSAPTLERAENLQVIARHGVGLDNIDIEAASEQDILVCNTPGANARSVAEHAVMLLMAARRRAVRADRMVRSGDWDREPLLAPELGGRTLGLFGYGAIGSIVAELARGIGMSVVVYDPYVEGAPDWIEFVDSKVALFERSTAVSVHTPLTDETRGAIGQAELAALGTEGVIVNTARGGIVDHDALFEALEAGTIHGAGIDVYPEEPPESDPVLEAPNVVRSPHVGAMSTDAFREMSTRAADNVRAVYEGRVPEDAVNADAVSIDGNG